MEKFLVVVECAIKCNDKFLFIKRPHGVHAGGFLAFPGGKVEYKDGGENVDILEQAVKREVLEEVGLNLTDPIHFVTSTYFVDSSQEHVLDTIFYCNIQNTIPEIVPSIQEVPQYYWLTTSEALSHIDTPIWLKHSLSCVEKKMECLNH
jgi:8-oxo-dGTP pyrophosphatase MutT (NUDIX family)